MLIVPLRTDSPLRRTPSMNWALIAANFAVFLLESLHAPQQPGEADYLAPYMLQAGDPHLWQYFTYAFLHANLLHIFGNMLFLYIFGNNVNDRMGNLGYLAFYLAGGVIAGVGYVVFQRQGSVLGASGAVAAVTGAYLILLPKSNITIFYWLFFFFDVIQVASLWFILLFFAMDIVGQAIPAIFGGDEAVAHAAHISGTIFGAAVSVVLLATGLLPRDQFDIVALGQRWNRRRQYRDMVSSGYNPFGFGGAPPPDQHSPQRPPDAMAIKCAEIRDRASQAAAQHDFNTVVQLYQQLLAQDPNQVLSRTVQLDVANYLAAQHHYSQAAAAYEQYQRYYPTADQIEQVYLMLGMIYSRHLAQPLKARDYLQKAIPRLHFSRELDVAQSELAHVQTLIPPGT